MRQFKITIPKPTKEEKAEIRKENKSWTEFLRRLKAKDALITTNTVTNDTTIR